TTSASDAGLGASTVYSYAISAVDNAGNESLRGVAASAATPACPTTTSTTTTSTTSSTSTTTTSTTTTTRTTSTTMPPDTTAPSVPTGVTPSAVSCGQINLAWTVSTDTGGSGLKGYNVHRNGVFLKQVFAPATSTSDAGLAASTVYAYAVSAVDNAG